MHFTSSVHSFTRLGREKNPSYVFHILEITVTVTTIDKFQ